jgi:hypothetical protein
VVGDVSAQVDARRMLETAIDHFGRLDVLVANAGIVPLNGILETTVEHWGQVKLAHCPRSSPSVSPAQHPLWRNPMREPGRSRTAFQGFRPTRRALAAMMTSIMASLCTSNSGSTVAVRDRDPRVVGFDPLFYTDRAGNILARIRPYEMRDVSADGESQTPSGQRDLWVRVGIQSTSGREIMAPASAFALWDCRGYLHRSRDYPNGVAVDDGGRIIDATPSEMPPTIDRPAAPRDVHSGGAQQSGDPPLLQDGRSVLLEDKPIAPYSDAGGVIRFRVPSAACLAGLVFTPEPDRVLVVANFRRRSTVIID